MIDLTGKPELRISKEDANGNLSKLHHYFILFEKVTDDGLIFISQFEYNDIFRGCAPTAFAKELNIFYENSLRIYNKLSK